VPVQTLSRVRQSSKTDFRILWAASLCHMLNDMLQALLPAVYPILQGGFDLSFAQVGFLTFTYQLTASLLQPFIGLFADRRPMPYSLPVGMAFSMGGLLTLAYAANYATLLTGAILLGLGSSIFHPESSRITCLASGGSHGLAQSLFQVGGNFGTALGPLAAAFFVLPRGQHGLAWFALAALAGIIVLSVLGRWYQLNMHVKPIVTDPPERHVNLSRSQVARAFVVLLVLLFSKWFYLASFTSFYIFYLKHKFAVPTQTAQILLFVFLAAVAVGTVVGGPIGDKFSRKLVIWLSILGALPFTLVLPHVGLTTTATLTVVIGFIMASAFPAIVVFGQELLPNRIGMVSGLFFGFAFGIGGIGAAVLGSIADWRGIDFIFQAGAFLPALGILAMLLPNLKGQKSNATSE
jgi:FSR family fosmidomycin resistance protein-like MFS transporter